MSNQFVPGILDATTGQYTTPPDNKAGEAMNRWANKNVRSTFHLSAANKMAAQAGIQCYVYNISPVFMHPRRIDGFGQFLIPRAPKVGSTIVDKKTGQTRKATPEDIAGEYRLSKPIVLNHSYVRTFTTIQGNGKLQPYIEYGEDLAEDLVGCSEKYPLDLTSEKEEYSKNLKGWGVFIVYGKPFEDLTPAEQNKLLTEAIASHTSRCIEKVNRGDMLFSNYKMRGKGGPLKIHRECAAWLAENVSPEYAEREWVTQRADMQTTTGKIECPFCGSKVKATVAKCPVCQEIVDADRYEKLSHPAKKAKAKKDDEKTDAKDKE